MAQMEAACALSLSVKEEVNHLAETLVAQNGARYLGALAGMN